MDWINFAISVLTMMFGGGLGVIFTARAMRKKAEAEALKAAAEAKVSEAEAVMASDKVWAERLDQMREEVVFEREQNEKMLERNRELIERMKDKEDRFQEQTQVVRKHVAEVIELTKRLGDKELELAMVRCEVHDCPWRKPPTAHTPPHPNLDKDEWHAERLRKEGEDGKV